MNTRLTKPYERWKKIPSTDRLTGLFLVIMAIFTLAVDVRPHTEVASYWNKLLGLSPDVVILILVTSTFALPLVWGLFRNLFAISIVILPLTALMSVAVWRVLDDPKASLTYAVMAGTVVVFTLVLFYGAKELEEEKALNKKLLEEIALSRPPEAPAHKDENE